VQYNNIAIVSIHDLFSRYCAIICSPANCNSINFNSLPLPQSRILRSRYIPTHLGIYIFDTTPYFNSATTSFNPSTFTISFAGRTHSSTNYSFGYSINHITYTISNHQVNYTLASTSKTSTSVTMSFYTNNANKISNLAIAYILI
jgi:hypothetical protein